MIYPDRLNKGDRIAIISPSTTVKEEFVRGAEEFLCREGFVPVRMPHALGPDDGSFASSRAARMADFHQAWSDPSIRAVLCARGGYGAVDLLGEFNPDFLRLNAKWLIGFSDITALHAMLLNAGVASIHGPMAKHIALRGDDDPCTRALMRILEGMSPLELRCASDSCNVAGVAEGRLIGGNMAVFGGLAGSDYDIFHSCGCDDVILVIEDVAEKIYKIERMLHNMRLSGVFGRVKGLIIGRFTEYGPDANHPSMEAMITRFLHRYGFDNIPAVYDFPVGHVDENYPFVEGAMAQLSVPDPDSGEQVKLVQHF